MKPFFQDGNVTLYHGDCREIAPMLETVDLVIGDPPYGDTSLVWDTWPERWISAIRGVAQLWCFGSMRMFLDNGKEFSEAGFRYGQEVVWEKHNGSGFHADRFKRVHEFAMQWYREPWGELTLNPVMVAEATARSVKRKTRPTHTGHIDKSAYRSEDGGPKLMRSVQYVRSCHGHAIHPTEKPVGILTPLIEYSSSRGDTILDPFAGSGSTLEAARAIGRKAIGIEINEEYCEAAAQRLSQEVFAL